MELLKGLEKSDLVEEESQLVQKEGSPAMELPGEGEEVFGVDAPPGFKMIMVNGRMVLRMR